MLDKKCCDSDFNSDLMAGKKIKLVSAVAFLDKDKRILLTKRPEGKFLAGYWEFPGGEVKEGESVQLTVVREVYEELGLKICAGCLVPNGFTSYPYEDFHLLLTLFACYNWEGIPIGKEGQELQWAKISEIQNFEMPEANQFLIPLIRTLL